MANPNQADYDKDGIGNICDNCPFISNPLQEDSNGNGIGDICEGINYGIDTDGDGIPDSLDNVWHVYLIYKSNTYICNHMYIVSFN